MREGSGPSGIQKAYMNSNLRSYVPGLLAILLLVIFGQILRPGFASPANISSILNQASVLAVVCIGQLVVIVGTGGIDLSTGACVSMGALVGSMFMDGKMSQLPLAILVTLLLGVAAGCINGIGIQFFKIPALAMTLIMSTVIDGFTKAVTKGKPSLNLPKLYKAVIGQPIVGRFCAIILIAAVFVVLYELLLGKTRFGKSIYVMGSNSVAAGMCGLNIPFLSVFVYVISGAMASLAGLILVGYVGSGRHRGRKSHRRKGFAAGRRHRFRCADAAVHGSDLHGNARGSPPVLTGHHPAGGADRQLPSALLPSINTFHQEVMS